MFLERIAEKRQEIKAIIEKGAFGEGSFFDREIKAFLSSPKRRNMLCAQRYYKGEQDILRRRRTVIGERGEVTEVTNLPNHRIVDNQYARLIDQKTNYLLGKPITYSTEDKRLLESIKEILNNKFERTMRAIGRDYLNMGCGWLYIFINDRGEFDFMRFRADEIIPFWKDREHTRLECAVRIITKEISEGGKREIKQFAEIYKENGIDYYRIEKSGIYLMKRQIGYFFSKEGEQSWGKIPLIAFKAENEEPLLKRVKSLQDGLNEMRSDFLNNMQEDKRNTILVIKNYDGTDLGEFRRNLAQYGAVKVRTIDGAEGGIETLSVEVNRESYQAICDMLKKAIIENGRGIDTKDERFNNNPNQMNIMSIYSDIDLDTDSMESEFQAGFEDIFYFVKAYLELRGEGKYMDNKINVIFNREQMINEGEVIDNCVKSKELLSERTIIEQHPWINDVYSEIKRKNAEKKAGEE